MGKENIYGLMDQFIKGSGKMPKEMGKAK